MKIDWIRILIESLVTSLFIAFLFFVWKNVFSPHRLVPIDLRELSIKRVAPTVIADGNTSTIGLETRIPFRIQNQGGTVAKSVDIRYQVPPQGFFSGGLLKKERNSVWIYPGETTEHEFKWVLNTEESIIGSYGFDINVGLYPKQGSITFFTISTFINPTHESMQSSYISKIIKQNRFKSFLIRKWGSTKNKFLLFLFRILNIEVGRSITI